MNILGHFLTLGWHDKHWNKERKQGLLELVLKWRMAISIKWRVGIGLVLKWGKTACSQENSLGNPKTMYSSSYSQVC